MVALYSESIWILNAESKNTKKVNRKKLINLDSEKLIGSADHRLTNN